MPTSYSQNQADQERKRFLMWLWVAVITAAIVIGWLFTFRSAAKKVLSAQSTENSTQNTVEDFQKQLNKSLEDFKKTWGTIKNQ